MSGASSDKNVDNDNKQNLIEMIHAWCGVMFSAHCGEDDTNVINNLRCFPKGCQRSKVDSFPLVEEVLSSVAPSSSPSTASSFIVVGGAIDIASFILHMRCFFIANNENWCPSLS